jgi:hypothetical protein
MDHATEMEHKHLRSHELFNLIVNNRIRIPLRPDLTLREWQILGVVFLLLSRDRIGFALLADEMGVGKVDPSLNIMLMNRLYKRWCRFI